MNYNKPIDYSRNGAKRFLVSEQKLVTSTIIILLIFYKLISRYCGAALIISFKKNPPLF